MKKPPQIPLTDTREIRTMILDMVSESWERLTPRELEKRMSQTFGTEKKAFKTAIKSLVEDNEIVYTYDFGCSFLEKSMNRPIRISKRIVLKPPGMIYVPSSDEIVITIKHGASFGTGGHPTTRIAIRGIEYVLSNNDFFQGRKRTLALDIGTGSGILAIAAVLLGTKKAVGIDIDPCARMEAEENAKLNALERRIEIHDRKVEEIDKKFSLITANLRYPTLKRLSLHLAEILEKGGSVVVSGIRRNEIPDLLKSVTQKDFRCVWKEIEKDWAGLVFDR